MNDSVRKCHRSPYAVIASGIGTTAIQLASAFGAYVITTAGSKTYLLQVKNGVVHRVPVRVQLEDGVQAKVAVLVHEANIATGEDEVLEELTGEEEIVRSGQGEVADGQDVRPMLVDW